MDHTELILREAAKMFIKFGIKNVTMDDISHELHVSKRTLYELFHNKHDLVERIVLSQIDSEKRLLLDIISESENAIDIMLRSSKFILHMYSKLRPTVLFDLKRIYPDIWQNVESFNNEYIRKMIEKNLVRGKKEHLYRQDLEPKILSTFYTLSLQLFANEDNEELKEFNFVDLTNQFFKYHLYGIMSEKGRAYFNKNSNKIT